jgi:predicted  nucleic acid-binding Zn-ribbon protein
MADQTQSTENTPTPMSLREAQREVLLWAGVIGQAIAAEEIERQHEATIRTLTGEVARLTRDRDALATTLAAEREKASKERTDWQEALTALQAKVEAARREHGEFEQQTQAIREEYNRIRASLGVPAAG